jgi:hypothetical protein
MVHRFGHSNSYLFFRIRLAKVTKVCYYIIQTFFQLGTTFSMVTGVAWNLGEGLWLVGCLTWYGWHLVPLI